MSEQPSDTQWQQEEDDGTDVTVTLTLPQKLTQVGLPSSFLFVTRPLAS